MADSNTERLYYRNGQLRQETPYEDRQLHGIVRTWHKNGVLASEAPYVQGKLHGICRQWSEDGKPLGSYEMIHGTGIQRQWHANGHLKLEFSTIDGTFTGRSRAWLRDGTLVHEEYLVNNESVSREDYRTAAIGDQRLPNCDDDASATVAQPGPELDCKQHELFVAALLEKPNHTEARQWLAGTPPAQGKPSLGSFDDRSRAAELVEQLYAAGATSIIAADIYFNNAQDQFCDCLLIQLPSLSADRSAVREACNRLCTTHNAALQPDDDIGESHLYLYFG
ncbi:MAG: hypothetical protein KGS61_21930 [Verrucomicrobia bacterium]|nr:hypothetical protein [Verrucomicrobiota bacterium]